MGLQTTAFVAEGIELAPRVTVSAVRWVKLTVIPALLFAGMVMGF